MNKILMSLLMIIMVATVATGATNAYLSDTETSTGNTFAAGSLDLNVDGGNTNVVKFNVSNLRPGNQPIGTWRLNNVGTLNGYLNLKNIALTNAGGAFTDPEAEAGDPENAGNLGTLLDVQLFVDTDGNGWVGTGEPVLYSGPFGGLADHYNQNLLIPAGGANYVTLQVNWHSHAGTLDNKGQGDTATLDMTFELDQSPI
ncbi:MAG: TasA family protein [Candidatus Daviesbacteria bacterium]|nr:TasA family protein [Candidatus Daviesbacteria bacterium]